MTAHDEKVGLLACWGEYPLVLARALRGAGYRTYCLGVRGLAEGNLAPWCEEFRWIGLCKLGGAIRYFRRRGVRRATMVGKVHKTLFYQPWFLWRHLPDGRAVRAFAPYLVGRRGDCRDDTLTYVLIDQFARDGISFEPPTDFVPEILVDYGQLTRRAPTPKQADDIAFGWRLAKEMGRLDVGQTVTVKNRAPLAIEAIEGTDACIRRTRELCSSGGFTVVKVAKPQQDMRFDVPTIGLGTLQAIAEAGGRVLAVEAEKTVFLNQEDVVRFANRNKIAIVALKSGACEFVQPEKRAA